MKNLCSISLLFATGILWLGCAQPVDSEDARTDGPYFPRMLQPAEAQMEALLIGKLVLENNCFQIHLRENDETLTPIWPAGFDYQLTTDSVFIILNEAGNEVARTGAGIRVSGGEIRNTAGLEDRIEGGASGLLLSCAVPYWIVGNEISTVALDAGLSPRVREELAPWFDFYAPHIDDWRLSAFALSDRWTIDTLLQMPDADVFPMDGRPVNWLIHSPNGRFNLDLYARDVMLQDDSNGKRIAYALSPDSEVAIEDLGQNLRQRLLFCGTPCRFETGFWEDEQSVIIAGLHQGEEGLYHPTIWRIRLDDRSVQEYAYPTPLPDPFPYNYMQEVVFVNL